MLKLAAEPFGGGGGSSISALFFIWQLSCRQDGPQLAAQVFQVVGENMAPLQHATVLA